MKRINNNKGSILALTIIIFGVFCILGTSVLGIAVTNYKIKKANTIMKTNSYIAEAGLEETYAKFYEIVTLALNDANEAANEELAVYNEDLFNEAILDITMNELSDSDIANKYKYIKKTDTGYTFDQNYIEDKAAEEFAKKFQKTVTAKIAGANGIINDKDMVMGLTENSTVKLELLEDSGKSGEVKNLLYGNLTSGNFKNGELELKITSNFEDKGVTRTASTCLTIKTPVYKNDVTTGGNLKEYNYIKEPYSITNEVKKIYMPPICSKLIVTDNGIELNAPTDKTLTLDGDMYAISGIVNNGYVNWEGNVATRGDINLKEGSTLNINSSSVISANNIELNDKNVKLYSNGENNNHNEIYIKDDLEMNNSNQIVNLDNTNYYGFSNGEDSVDNKVDNSSCIVINSPDIESGGSSIDINGDVCLYGTAYIALDDNAKYQTGESVSVKGNYVAYTYPLTDKNSKYYIDNVMFSYIKPLVLFSGFNEGSSGEINVFDKIDYFKEYYKESLAEKYNDNIEDKKPLLTLSNVNVGKNKGDAGNNDKILGVGIKSGSITDLETNVGFIADNVSSFREYKNTFYRNTHALGLSDAELGVIKNTTNYDELNYNTETEINFSALDKFDDSLKTGNTYQRTLELSGKNYSVIYNTDTDENETITIDVNGEYNGLIITNGDVVINGIGTFTGCIIAKGKVTINSDDLVLKYDENVVKFMLMQFSELQDAFIIEKYNKLDNYSFDYNASQVNVFRPETGSGELYYSYDNKVVTDALQFSNWMINYEN